MSIEPIVRIPCYPRMNLLEENVAPANFVVETCIGTRRKYAQRVLITEDCLWNSVMFASLNSETERFEAFGKQHYGVENYVGFRLWAHDKKTRRYTVDYAFWKYKWEHSTVCDGQDHELPR